MPASKATPAIYFYDHTTYLDPENLPSKRSMALRGVIEWLPLLIIGTSPISVPAAMLGTITVQVTPNSPPEMTLLMTILGIFLALLFPTIFLLLISYKNSKDNREAFVAAGGNPTRYNFWAFAGMLPMGKGRASNYPDYKFADPEKLQELREHCTLINTNDRIFF